MNFQKKRTFATAIVARGGGVPARQKCIKIQRDAADLCVPMVSLYRNIVPYAAGSSATDAVLASVSALGMDSGVVS